MEKTRHWLLPALGSLVIVACCSASAASAASLVEHNAIPNVEQRWNPASFSSLLESGSPPEFGRCIKTTGGAYEDSGCTTTGSGKSYEWYPAFGSSQPLEKVKFTEVIKPGTTAVLETVLENAVTCEEASGAGEYTGNKTVGSVVLTFTGCASFEASCTSEGEATGTIVTNALEGVIGIEELGAEPLLNKIGQDLYPPGHSGPMGKFSCGGTPMSIEGSIISPVNADAMKLTTTIKSKAVKGKQRPENFVEEPPEVLKASIEGGWPEQAGMTVAMVQTNEEKVEINTVN